jgi:two-component system, OmpR family, sensor kinase
LAALAYVLILAIVALGVPSAINLKARVRAEVRTQSQGQADLVAATAADLLRRPGQRGLTALAESAAQSVRGRILIVDATGRVVVDSAGPGQVGTSYASRPEIKAALAGRQIQLARSSRTLGQDILATAVPIIRNGHPVGAVRVTQSVSAVNSAVWRAILGLGLLALVVLGVGLLAGGVIAGQVVRPIKRLEQVAKRVAGGDLLARATPEGSREQRSLARSFNDMTDRVSRLLSAQRDFVADASHQLRTPLTGLRLRLEQAQELTDETAETQVRAAIAEVDRLSAILDELLALSAADVYQDPATAVNLDEVAGSVVGRWRAEAATMGRLIEHRPGARGQIVHACAPDLERVLDVLVENAIRYSPAGAPIVVSTTPHTIEVLDRGPGVSEDERELVFERFHRGRAGRSGPPGSGLGLSIARELARRWGGEVSLAAREGGGTVARLSLPREPSALDAEAGASLPLVNPPASTVP